MRFADVLGRAVAEKTWIVDLRRRLHQIPELRYQEFETKRLVLETLREIGISSPIEMAETGLVATVGSGDGPCVALRADMDALPIHELTDVHFRSQRPGVMHACGHDCHTAMLLGAAKILKSIEDDLPGKVKLIFQPAEEGGAGADRLINEGALDNPKVDRVFGLHVWPTLPTGQIASRGGVLLAAAGEFRLTVRGRGGHAAFPHITHDPIVAISQIIGAFQSIVARESDPLSPTVLSVTSVHGGTAYNVVPGEVVASGTIRSLRTEELHRIREAMRRVAENIARAMRCEAVLEDQPGDPDYPATVNTPECWETAKTVAAEFISRSDIHEISPVMGGEDFAFYLEKVPGCFVVLGIRNDAIGANHFVHTPFFKVDEEALPLGAAMHVGFALRSLEELIG
ncbi:MAG: putative hydrolase YxeP [Planctomycetota bacterium]|jgi:IAA-amino acid hydrolase